MLDKNVYRLKNYLKVILMSLSKSEKGKKRLCENCSTRWYDLNKKPIVCPVCKQETDENELLVNNLVSAQSLIGNKKISSDNSNKFEDHNEEEAGDLNEDSDIISLDEVESEEN